ncbi:MAG TPA: CapA family protein [Acidobacteriota bacterium]|nr:CapA family protein [Acidobacteriota bacterium]
MRNDNHPITDLSSHRILLCTVILLAGVITTTAPVVAQLPADPDPKRELEMTVAKGFTVTAVGDVIIARPISQGTNLELTEVFEILQRPDVTFGNFETSAIDLQDFDGYQAAEHGGAWLIGPPAIAYDLKAMGFDMMARANNHTTDWGVEGMRSTTKILDEAGIVHAGAGETLALARAGRYFETPKGRVAVVSMASSFTPLSRTMNSLGEAPGRPGLSPVRTTRHTLITQQEMDVLVGIRDSIAAYRKWRN